MKNIRRRVDKLENRIPKEPPGYRVADLIQTTFLVCIAFYLGQPGPSDSVASAYARAIGYDRPGELLKASEEGDADLDARHRAAVQRLMDKCGVRPPDQDGFVDDLVRMEAGLSPHFRSVLHHRLKRPMK